MTITRHRTANAPARRFAIAAMASVIVALLSGPAAATDGGWAAVTAGSIVLLRHAEAPGTGDPPGFRVGDCTTQRNLSAAGRAQSVRIGEAFRARGISVGKVLSSQWCRCVDTAELAFPGRVEREPAFNSFFENRSSEQAQTASARAILSAWTGPGVLVVSTHQVNITALTGAVPSSGEAIVVRPARGKLDVVGRIKP